jgi:hypothetical protein
MPGYSREEPAYSEKSQREALRARLRFPGVLVVLSFAGAAFFVWQDRGVSTSAIWAACFGAFWAVPLVMAWLQLRKLK